ncbi:hypothetical protein D3C76_951460 [compost metagenome]
MRQDPGCGAYGTNGLANAFCLAGERISVRAGGVAVQDQGLGECGCLVAALLIGQGEDGGRRCRHSERVDETEYVAAKSTGRRPNAAEHVLELAALLQEYR